MTRIDTEVNGQLDRFVELCRGAAFHQFHRFVDVVGLLGVHTVHRLLEALRNLRHRPYSRTWMPIERAEPSIRRIAMSTSLAFRSFILAWAISRTCALVTVPANVRPGALEPLSSFAAFLRKYDAGGVFISKEKDLSEYTVMFTGIGMLFSICCVLAWTALQNSMMFKPRWPSAGPIGGDGFAAPAGTCNLM